MIVAIETATEVCSTALIHREKVLSERSLNEKNIHSERLLMLIDEVIKESRIEREQLNGIAVSIGPGSFTGLRIGLSAAKGLAMALRIPIIAVPTLDGIAEAYRMSERLNADEIFCAMIDAKRDEAYYAFYSITQYGIKRQSDFSIKLKSGIFTEANDKRAIVQQPIISALSIGRLAVDRQREYCVSDFSYLEPMYLRDFVATVPKKKV